MKPDETGLAKHFTDVDAFTNEMSLAGAFGAPVQEPTEQGDIGELDSDSMDQLLDEVEAGSESPGPGLVIEEGPLGCKYCGEVKPPSAMQGRTCKNCAYHRRQRRRALLLLVCGQCGKEKPGTAFRPDKPVCRACENGDISKDGLTNFCPNCNEDLTSYLEFHAQNRNEATEELLQEYEQENKLIICALERRIVALGGEPCGDE